METEEGMKQRQERGRGVSLHPCLITSEGGGGVREDEDGRKESETEEGGNWQGVGGLR